jgi:hypothetical protein
LGNGVYTEGDFISVKSTKASGNGGHGIYVSGDTATLKGNRVEGNGFPGGSSDGLGQGILVQGFATAPAGTNIARGNDDPANCQPSSICPAAASKSVKAGVTPITTCGQVVTTYALLTQDLTCAGTGVIVGASGITIDLNGHVLKGNGSAYGIYDNGYDKVAIKNGVVRNFVLGVNAVNSSTNVVVSKVVAAGNTNHGIYIEGASASVDSSNASGNVQSGVQINGASVSIRSSTAAGNGTHGIWVTGEGASIKSSSALGNAGTGFVLWSGQMDSVVSSTAAGNGAYGVNVAGGAAGASVNSTTASANGSDGIVVSGDNLAITGNRAEANGFPGGSSDGLGRGILAVGYTTQPAGKNVTRGNDDPVECNPSSLC